VAGALVVLPHRQRRTPQRLGLRPLQRLAFELLGQLGCDHLEDPTTQDSQRLRIVVFSELDQVVLRGCPLLGRDCELAGAREPLQRGDDRPALRQVDPARSHRRREDFVLLEVLGEPEVGAGLAAYLPRLDRDPVRRSADTRLDRDLGALGLGQQPQRQRLQLGSTSGEGDQGGALVFRAHRHQRRIGQRVEPRNQPLGEVKHRVEVLDRLATHG
jgi:hypothetical protein